MCSLSDVTLAIVDCEHKTAPTQPFGIPSIRTTDIKNGRLDLRAAKRVSEETYREWTARMEPQEGDLILAREAPVGEVGLVPPDTRVCLGQRTVLVRPDPEKAVPRYLLFLLLTPQMQHELKSRAEGSTTPHLNVGDIREFELPELPELPEQNRIAHILGTLDDKIELNRRMNRTLEAIARAIFKSWFIDFDPVIDNAILNGKPIPDEFAARAAVRREILARNQPSPPSSLPEVEGRNYRGGFEFAGLVERARELRQKQTPVEEILWELLRDRRFLDLKFRRQHQIGDYIADFYCHEQKLVIELDGGIHRTQEAKDAKRDAYMRSLGLSVLRFQNTEVLDSTETVLAQIASALDVSPSPSGRGDGERTPDQSPSTFGRGASGEGVADYRHLFPDSFEDSPLGKIPKGWKVAALGNIAARRQETVKPGSIEDETPYVALDDMPRESIALSSWKHAEGIASSKSRFRKGDVLFGKLRPYFHKVVAAPTDGVCSTDIVVVRAKQEKWSAFLLMLCSIKEFVAYNSAVMTGTKMPRTNWKDMSKYELACPPDAIVEAYEAATLPLIQQIVASIHECRQLSSVRETLLAPLLSREVVVRDNNAQRDYQ